MPTCYQLNASDASVEVFDDEVLAINLRSGHYHSVRGIGVEIWSWLTAGWSDAQMAAGLRDAFLLTGADFTADVTRFLGQLTQAGLIVPDPSAAGQTGVPATVNFTMTYEAPQLESHTDMQDLLLIDPIHDVDVEVGWPLRAGNESEPVA